MKLNILKSLSLLDEELDDMDLTDDRVYEEKLLEEEREIAAAKKRRAEVEASLAEETVVIPKTTAAEEASEAPAEADAAKVQEIPAPVTAETAEKAELEEDIRIYEREETEKAPAAEIPAPEPAPMAADAGLMEQQTIIMEPVRVQEPVKNRAYILRRRTGEIIAIDRDTFILGTMPVCADYVITGNSAVSRIHAVIKYEKAAGQYILADCRSTNHTYLDGTMVAAGRANLLKDGMRIHLASEEFIFHLA